MKFPLLGAIDGGEGPPKLLVPQLLKRVRRKKKKKVDLSNVRAKFS